MSIESARRLRRNPTDAERRLWQLLRHRQLEGLRFRRQAPVGVYVLDFVCFEAALVVEIDGGQHAIEKAADEHRSAWLESQGFRILRFWNNDVLGNPEGVVEAIRSLLRG